MSYIIISLGDDLMQVIYNGSYQIIKKPEIIENKFNKDFIVQF